mmetsp:Transcript_11682/g.21062  ORF Transcript_11682/g.21062 Transcript_11682/m.21062 type:complete len:236 (+) Transcript_11682:113-820(+)
MGNYLLMPRRPKMKLRSHCQHGWIGCKFYCCPPTLPRLNLALFFCIYNMFLHFHSDPSRRQKTQEDKGGDSDETGKKKPKKNKKFANDSPHRIECLAELGVVWESHHENKWETMFQKLLHYKEEMGTLRFPPDDQCAATGDAELIALQKWVKSQVLSVRHGKKKNAETTKRLLDIGFDFEKWYARSGKKRRAKEEDDAVDDVGVIARSTMQEGDCRQPTTMVLASSERENVEMEV